MINKKTNRLLFLPFFITILISAGCGSAPQPEVIYRDREVRVPVQVTVEVPVPVSVVSEAVIPLTVNILNDLRMSPGFNINQCQFFLSGRIVLERDDEEEKQGLIDGRAVFEASHTRRNITIEDQTAGLAFRMLDIGGETELSLWFEDDDRYVLVFGAAGGDNSQFVLKYISQNDPLSGTRGSLEYGGQSYRLRYTGGTPVLMINLEIRGEPVTNRQTVPGRSVSPAGPAGSETPVALTMDILNRLRRSENFDINQCQFFLSGRFVLERIEEERRVFVTEGKAVVENNHTTRLITFDDQTKGIALRIEETPGGLDLYLCFDTDDRFQLRFSAPRGEPTARFSLQFTAQHDPLSDARGSVEYRGQTFRLRFSGGTPFLMLNLSQIEDTRLQQRTAPGRRVSPGASPPLTE